ncbi:pentatricopeptide repeat-containing protein At1g11290, chloroplastic-like [Carica papaya]|uniref:pentatricopeptide repeat-containing protein At1g11290, chloroplastic-like n=1 Tax=Carica papaya TaxID=3649 RepID=UPI000B8D1176|nr:pentatricopeptide repeat-containing protein At1g11290, chloroplastic-like [Carica papaya]
MTLLVYQEMLRKLIYPDETTYPFVFRACSCLLDVQNGKTIHAHVVKLGLDSFYFVSVAFQEMYRGCGGQMWNEHEVIDKRSVKDFNYWNSSISEASNYENVEESFRLFTKMRMKNFELDSCTVVHLLRMFVDLNLLKTGKIIHGLVVLNKLTEDMSVNTALLSMYSKLGSLGDARLLFDKMPEKDGVVWNVMISGYSQHGYPEKSMELMSFMVKSGVGADLFTAIPAVSSIKQLKSIEWGRQMHAFVLRCCLDYQVSLHNALIDMYCECNHLNYARKVFDLVKNKTVVSWSTMIKGCVSHNQSLDAFSLFTYMKLDGTKPDFVTVINILPACVNIGALKQVKYLHGYSSKSGLTSFSSVNTAILISYAKCGAIEMARKLFDGEKVDSKDIITWNSMISAYSKHGDWSKCFMLYNQMKQSNMKPDQVTFLGLLTACVNSGLVEEGRGLFNAMESYGFRPCQEHYTCMVDLLGRAGHINEARQLIKTMPMKPDAQVWAALLSACKLHCETEIAEFAAKELLDMEPKNAGNYILLSNIYAAAGQWAGVAKMRSFLRDTGLKKTPGCSWLEIQGHLHEFRVADRSHPKSGEIYAILQNLEVEIMEIRDKDLGIRA